MPVHTFFRSHISVFAGVEHNSTVGSYPLRSCDVKIRIAFTFETNCIYWVFDNIDFYVCIEVKPSSYFLRMQMRYKF